MRCVRKEMRADAYIFGPGYEVEAPAWFTRAVDRDEIDINRALKDGAIKVYGCSIHGRDGRLTDAKVGDYVVRLDSGEIVRVAPERFRKEYEQT